MLHLAGVKQVDKHGKPTGELAVHARRHQEVPPAAQPLRRAIPRTSTPAGIETTTGPLGQGCGNSVGMAIASRWLAARYNRPGFELFDFNVYALCSDGDLMEGVCERGASLAGHLKLSNLCWIYDDNRITIEGDTELAFSEDVATRFEGLGWNVLTVDDANDLAALRKAFRSSAKTDDRPTLIIVRKRIIGYGSPNKANTHEAHGAPLGADEIKLTKKAYGWPEDAQFLVPDGSARALRRKASANAGSRRRAAVARASFAAYARSSSPSRPPSWTRCGAASCPPAGTQAIPTFPADAKGMATRISGGKVLNALAPRTALAHRRLGRPGPFDDDAARRSTRPATSAADNYAGRNFHFGIREHGMAAALQRHVPLRPAALRRDVLRLHRLPAALDAAGRHHAPAGDSTS